jgi:hypothetical protein
MAVFAISAVVSAPAYALPEFKPSTKQKFTGKQVGSGTLENTAGEKVSCTGGGGPGEIASATLVAKVVVKFTGCSSSGQECLSSGASAKEIRTKTLKGELGEEKTGKVTVEGLEAETGKTEAEFECSPSFFKVKIKVTGGVICKVEPVGPPATTKGKLNCEQSGGKQKYTSFEGSESKTVRTLELIEENTKQNKTLKSGEMATAEIEYEKAVEVT